MLGDFAYEGEKSKVATITDLRLKLYERHVIADYYS